MALIRPSSARPRFALVTQLALSVTATVTATLIVTVLQQELTSLHPAAPSPELTTGGKFAARVEGLRAEADQPFAPVFPLPPTPLLVADAGLSDFALSYHSDPAALPARIIVEPDRPNRRSVHTELKRRPVAEAVVQVSPPRRAEVLALAPNPAVADGIKAQAADIWSTTTGFYHQALWLGGSVLDRVNPLRLLP